MMDRWHLMAQVRKGAPRPGGVQGDMHMNNLMQDDEGRAWLIDFSMLKDDGERTLTDMFK